MGSERENYKSIKVGSCRLVMQETHGYGFTIKDRDNSDYIENYGNVYNTNYQFHILFNNFKWQYYEYLTKF